MERLTTDTPSGNFETMLNFVHGKDGWAYIYDADEQEVNLITWALKHCQERGCDDFQCETLEEYDEALSSCMVDFMDCPIAMAYCFASQAVHLRSRLKMYEDAMPLARVQELSQAEKDGRLVVMPPNDPLTLEELREMDGEPVWVEVSENWSKSGSKSGWYLVRFHKIDDRLRMYIYNTRSGATFVPEQDYVQSWIAYRRRPEEGTK